MQIVSQDGGGGSGSWRGVGEEGTESAMLGAWVVMCSASQDDQLALAPSLELTWCPLSLQ